MDALLHDPRHDDQRRQLVAVRALWEVDRAGGAAALLEYVSGRRSGRPGEGVAGAVSAPRGSAAAAGRSGVGSEPPRSAGSEGVSRAGFEGISGAGSEPPSSAAVEGASGVGSQPSASAGSGGESGADGEPSASAAAAGGSGAGAAGPGAGPGAEDAEWRLLFAEMLAEGDDAVARAALEWLGDGIGDSPAWLVEELASRGLVRPRLMAQRADAGGPEARSAEVIALLNSGEPSDAREGFRIADALLRSTGERLRAGIRAVGRARQERYAASLAPYLGNDDPSVRREAAAALGRLATPASTALVPALLAALGTADPILREGVLEALLRIADPGCVRPLLLAADDFGPDELRQAEAVLVEVGRHAVPATAAVLMDMRSGYASRRLAVRVLARASPRHLVSVGEGVLAGEASRARSRRLAARSLAASADDSAGALVLSRFQSDDQRRSAHLVLELLAARGRIPDATALAATLRFGAPGARAEALAEIRRGAGRLLFRTIRPLFVDESEERAGPVGRRRADGPSPDRVPIGSETLASPFPLEAAAAAQWCYDRDGLDALPGLRDAFRQHTSRVVRDTVAELVRRAAGAAPTSTPIETLRLLMEAALFNSLSIFELEAILAVSTPARFPSRRTLFRIGDPAESCYLVLDGTVEIRGPAGAETRGRTHTFGEEALLGAGSRQQEAVTSSATLLRIPRAGVRDAAGSVPDLDLALLRKREEVPGG